MSGPGPLQEVCAVIHPAAHPSGEAEETLGAVCTQSISPTRILLADTLRGSSPTEAARFQTFDTGRSHSSLAAGVTAAMDTGARWIWLLEAATVPKPDALSALGEAIAQLGQDSAPLLAVSKVVDRSGQLHPDALPRHEIFEKERSVEAAARHLVQLRAASPGSTLLSATAVRRFGFPSSDLPAGLDMWEWSARMLRRWEDTGYLVPASVAVRALSPVKRAFTPRYWAARTRLLAGDAWSPSEKLWEAFLLGEELLAVNSSRRRRSLRGPPAWGRRASARHADREG